MKGVKRLFLFCGIILVFGKTINAGKITTLESKNDTFNDDMGDNLSPSKKIPRLADRAEAVSLGEYPYTVSIQAMGKHFCGGALISPTAVITAAHCLYQFLTDYRTQQDAPYVLVELGSVTIGSGRSHQIRRMAVPKQFVMDPSNPFYLPYDVGVITLQTPVIGDTLNIKIINLPSPSEILNDNTGVIITGYGATTYGGPMSTYLRKVELYTVSTRECDEYYYTTFGQHILSTHICAKSVQGYGTCQGDSGSPLMYNRKIFGVVSGGNGQCGAGDPDVFTKVSDYLTFINYEMNQDFNRPGTAATSPSKGINIERPQSLSASSSHFVNFVVRYPIPPGSYPVVG